MLGDLDHECGRYCKSGTQGVDRSLQGERERPAGVKECIRPRGGGWASCTNMEDPLCNFDLGALLVAFFS